MRTKTLISRRALLNGLGSMAVGIPFCDELMTKSLLAGQETAVASRDRADKIARKDASAFNGAHCEKGVKMGETQADAHLVENSHTYIGYVTLDAHPGVVFFARVGASLFDNSPGCTAHVLTNENAKAPDAGQPALVSARTEYVRPGQASFLPKFQLFQTDNAGRPTTSASECIEGGLGSCWLMAAIASVAQHPGAISKLFRKTADGYEVELFNTRAGEWQTYSVDVALPACQNGSQFTPAYAKPATGDAPTIWPCLLEKAFAVSVNSFVKLNGGYPDSALRALTGSRTFNIYTAESVTEKLHAKVSEYLRTNYAIVASSKIFDRANLADIVFRGQIAQQHAYSILGSRTANGTPELQLRNPWGRLGLLNPEAAIQDQTDSTFWMPTSSIAEHFSVINAAKVK